MHGFGQIATAFLTMAFGLAIVAVIVSQNANTSGVIQAGGSALGGVIGAAVAPVTGASGTTTSAFSGLQDFTGTVG